MYRKPLLHVASLASEVRSQSGAALVFAKRFKPTTSGEPQNVGPSSPLSPSGVRGATHSAESPLPPQSEEKYRTLFPKVRLRAQTQRYQKKTVSSARPVASTVVDDEHAPHEKGGTATAMTSLSTTEPPSSFAVGGDSQNYAISHLSKEDAAQLSSVQQFVEEVQRQVDSSRHERNQTIPFPAKPEALTPEFRRIKRSTKMTIVVPDPDYPTFERKDCTVALPPASQHPWIKRATPFGPHIVHGDGQINMKGGTGLVGFDNTPEDERLPVSYRGLHHHSILQHTLPQDNGKVVQDAVVKHSFTLTGRGVFATRAVKKGDILMIVQSTSRNVGVKGEMNRLEEMCEEVLLAAHGGDERAREFLHKWILTGQPSSLLEHWPQESTQRVLEHIGGQEVLDDLELHPIHIARLASIMDLNSFLVESSYAERKGMAYFPEAGYLNHSCDPNATYDIMPEHVFRDSEYYLDEVMEEGEVSGEDGGEQKKEEVATVPPSPEGSALASAPAVSGAVFGSEDRLACTPDLTERDAPIYLFCCRAAKDIAVGEEICISYVPPQWSFDNRQYVLHDRYNFWCKCPKCAPVIDTKYARGPKMVVGMMVFALLLQGLVFYQRDQLSAVDEDFERLASLPEAERLEELRARGIDPKELTIDAVRRRREKRSGVLEMFEEEKNRKLYEWDNTMGMTKAAMLDPMSKPAR